MKRQFITILLGCLLIATAGVIVSTREVSAAETVEISTTTRSRDRHPRAARGITPARLLASTRQHTRESRETWVRSLNDAELKRLARSLISEMITACEEDQYSFQRDITSWLVPLTKEWGRRDIDGLFEDGTVLEQRNIAYELASLSVFANVRASALIGLSESDPQKALQLLPTLVTYTSFYIKLDLASVAEAVFRNWAKRDPMQAWQEISGSPHSGWNASAGIRGLIAGSSDTHLHDAILQWATNSNQRGEEAIQSGEDAIVTRSSIDSILNNPNRYNADELFTSVALGLAEHDPEKAWKWLNSQPEAKLGDIGITGMLFNSRTVKLLNAWAERQPQKTIEFIYNHPDQITLIHRLGAASSLFSREPEAALDLLAGIEDLQRRKDAVTGWMATAAGMSDLPTWPLTDSHQPSLPANQLTRRIIENLDRLALPASETTALRLELEKTRNAQEKGTD